jgi:hypothetical protein
MRLGVAAMTHIASPSAAVVLGDDNRRRGDGGRDREFGPIWIQLVLEGLKLLHLIPVCDINRLLLCPHH